MNELDRVAMKDPNHLKKWLEKTGRKWVIFDALDLVDSLPWPDGVDEFGRVVACYTNHRRSIPSNRTEIQHDPIEGKDIEVTIYKTDVLEKEECDRLIRHLIKEQSERFPEWKLEDPPL